MKSEKNIGSRDRGSSGVTATMGEQQHGAPLGHELLSDRFK